MKSCGGRRWVLALLPLSLLLLDALLNCLTLFPRSQDTLILIYMVQDLGVVSCGAGLAGAAAAAGGAGWRGARGGAAAAAGYAGLALAAQAAALSGAGARPVLAGLQRVGAPLYYHVYKRAALRLAAPARDHWAAPP